MLSDVSEALTAWPWLMQPAFCDIAPRSLVQVVRRFRGANCLALMLGAVSTFETLVNL
jgi:hypothetical protein